MTLHPGAYSVLISGKLESLNVQFFILLPFPGSSIINLLNVEGFIKLSFKGIVVNAWRVGLKGTSIKVPCNISS